MTNERLQHPIKKVMIWPNTGKEGMGLAVRQAADVLREFGAEVILAERALEIGIDTDGFLVHTLQKAMIEADFIVNAFEDSLDKKAVSAARKNIFKTETGKKLLDEMYLEKHCEE